METKISKFYDNTLVNSLLAFNNSTEHHEIIEYLCEHLYIQSQLAMPVIKQAGSIGGMTNFYQACKKLYCAVDEDTRKQAIDEIRLHIA